MFDCNSPNVRLNSIPHFSQYLKGPDRPVMELKHRMDLMSALPFVDAVTSFSDDTPLELIKFISPDVLAKGRLMMAHL